MTQGGTRTRDLVNGLPCSNQLSYWFTRQLSGWVRGGHARAFLGEPENAWHLATCSQVKEDSKWQEVKSTRHVYYQVTNGRRGLAACSLAAVLTFSSTVHSLSHPYGHLFLLQSQAAAALQLYVPKFEVFWAPMNTDIRDKIGSIPVWNL